MAPLCASVVLRVSVVKLVHEKAHHRGAEFHRDTEEASEIKPLDNEST